MSLVVNPYSYFTDTNGNALNGYLYVGEVGKNAENYPIAIFYDNLFTTPAPNPLTVSAGYIYNSGTIAQIYASVDYSIIVKKTDGSLVYSSLNETGMTNGAIANIDEMKNFVAPYDNYALNVLGYSEAGDGGGGLFYYDANSTEADNGGTIIEPISGSGRWVRQYSGAVNVKWFGAKGDGVSNDTRSFISLSNYVTSIGGKNIDITDGLYIVGYQEVGGTPYYKTLGSIIVLTDCSNMTISFSNASLKFENGLAYGSFDPTTGVVYTPPSGGFTDSSYAAAIGSMIYLIRCTNVIINNPVLHGNNENYLDGGYWGDTGIQLDSTGIRLSDCAQIIINNAKTDYFGLDGLYSRASTDNFKTKTVMNNCTSSFNGRQGLSITGGSYYTFNDCEFTNTARGGVSSAPRAGVDIESNGTTISNVVFNRCVFSSNSGADFLNLHPSITSEIYLNECTLHADGIGMAALWDEVGATYRNCKILGGADNAWSSKFYDCLFSNSEDYGFAPVGLDKVFRNGNANTYAERCNFEVVTNSLGDSELYITGDLSLKDCNYYVRGTDPVQRSRWGVIRPILAENFNIIEDFQFTAGNTGVDLSGEHAYIETSGTDRYTNWKGNSEFLGRDNLAWASRAGVTYLYIPLKTEEYLPSDTIRLSSGYAIFTRAITLTTELTDILEIPLSASVKITVAGNDGSSGIYGHWLAEDYATSDGSRTYHGAQNVLVNVGSAMAAQQWKSALATDPDSRILQLQAGSAADNQWIVRVEVFGDAGDTINWLI